MIDGGWFSGGSLLLLEGQPGGIFKAYRPISDRPERTSRREGADRAIVSLRAQYNCEEWPLNQGRAACMSCFRNMETPKFPATVQRRQDALSQRESPVVVFSCEKLPFMTSPVFTLSLR